MNNVSAVLRPLAPINMLKETVFVAEEGSVVAVFDANQMKINLVWESDEGSSMPRNLRDAALQDVPLIEIPDAIVSAFSRADKVAVSLDWEELSAGASVVFKVTEGPFTLTFDSKGEGVTQNDSYETVTGVRLSVYLDAVKKNDGQLVTGYTFDARDYKDGFVDRGYDRFVANNNNNALECARRLVNILGLND